MVKYVPDRADLIWLEFEPQKGKEICKTRPALVISPKLYNAKVGLALCVPITSQVKGYPFEVPIKANAVSGVILCDQIKSVDWKARNARFAGHADYQVFMQAIEKLLVLIKA